ncbi:hypothetical protein BJ165DRAFT_1596378 [Panaeolus papilionaceus]|nr:hypothetical protein BJ165DRAFT_1596378 [Panaeolus papilionaceus]
MWYSKTSVTLLGAIALLLHVGSTVATPSPVENVSSSNKPMSGIMNMNQYNRYAFQIPREVFETPSSDLMTLDALLGAGVVPSPLHRRIVRILQNLTIIMMKDVRAVLGGREDRNQNDIHPFLSAIAALLSHIEKHSRNPIAIPNLPGKLLQPTPSLRVAVRHLRLCMNGKVLSEESGHANNLKEPIE